MSSSRQVSSGSENQEGIQIAFSNTNITFIELHRNITVVDEDGLVQRKPQMIEILYKPVGILKARLFRSLPLGNTGLGCSRGGPRSRSRGPRRLPGSRCRYTGWTGVPVCWERPGPRVGYVKSKVCWKWAVRAQTHLIFPRTCAPRFHRDREPGSTYSVWGVLTGIRGFWNTKSIFCIAPLSIEIRTSQVYWWERLRPMLYTVKKQ